MSDLVDDGVLDRGDLSVVHIVQNNSHLEKMSNPAFVKDSEERLEHGSTASRPEMSEGQKKPLTGLARAQAIYEQKVAEQQKRVAQLAQPSCCAGGGDEDAHLERYLAKRKVCQQAFRKAVARGPDKVLVPKVEEGDFTMCYEAFSHQNNPTKGQMVFQERYPCLKDRVDAGLAARLQTVEGPAAILELAHCSVPVELHEMRALSDAELVLFLGCFNVDGRPSNNLLMHLAREVPVLSFPPDSGPDVGDICRLQNLQRNAWNGQEVKVMGFVTETQRVKVRMPDGKIILVWTRNLDDVPEKMNAHTKAFYASEAARVAREAEVIRQEMMAAEEVKEKERKQLVFDHIMEMKAAERRELEKMFPEVKIPLCPEEIEMGKRKKSMDIVESPQDDAGDALRACMARVKAMTEQYSDSSDSEEESTTDTVLNWMERRITEEIEETACFSPEGVPGQEYVLLESLFMSKFFEEQLDDCVLRGVVGAWEQKKKLSSVQGRMFKHAAAKCYHMSLFREVMDPDDNDVEDYGDGQARFCRLYSSAVGAENTDEVSDGVSRLVAEMEAVTRGIRLGGFVDPKIDPDPNASAGDTHESDKEEGKG